ncbi:MAG: hypothetical protein ACTHK7_04485, partial [Aureliella sp.]
QPAGCVPPMPLSRGFIRVSGDPAIPSVDRCALFAYVLCAASHWQTRGRLWTDASSGAIGREEFVSKWSRMDFETTLATQKILVRFGFTERASGKTPFTSGILSQENEYSAYKARWDAAKGDPANPFVAIGRMYDALRAATPPSPEV